MAELTPVSLGLGLSSGTYGGTDPGSYDSCASGGDYFVVTNAKKTFIHVKNGSGGALTVTVSRYKNCDQGHDHDIAVSVPATDERMIGAEWTNDEIKDGSGRCQISYSGVTSLTIKVFVLQE